MASDIIAGAFSLIDYVRENELLDRFVAVFQKKHQVMVLGSSGTGKTNLLKSLRKDTLPSAVDYTNRTEFVARHGIRILKHPFVFTDTPGQLLHISRRREALIEAAKGVAGILNVVSYGYHEYKKGRGGAFDEGGRINESFLESHRHLELKALEEWVNILGTGKTTGWLITVVSKADLWWDRRAEVMEYYENGAYYEALGIAKGLNPIVVEYCSVFHKFYGEGRLSGSFDDGDRNLVRFNLLRNLVEAAGGSTLDER